MADTATTELPDADDTLLASSNVKQLRRRVTQLGRTRLILTAFVMLLALGIARFSTDLPLFNNAERSLFDTRALVGAPHVDQDPRIAMVTYTDEVLRQTRVRSPLDRAILADALARLDRAGAKSIGIDILFDQPTDNDDRLIAQLRAMQTPTWVAYAEPTGNPNDIQPDQAAFLRDFLSRADGPHTRPASIRLATEADNSMRRWHGRTAGSPPMLSVAMAGVGNAFHTYRGIVRWRQIGRAEEQASGGNDIVPVFEKFPINTVADPAIFDDQILAELVRGRHILIGGDIIGSDQFTTPFSLVTDRETGQPRTMIGLEVHAHMLAQILDNAMLPTTPDWALWLIAIALVAAGAGTALLDLRPWQSALLLLVQFAIIAFVPVWIHQAGVDTYNLPVAGGATGWLLAFIATTSAVRAVGAEERAFAQSALGKYLPRDIAQEILRNPERLALHGEKKPIYCLFSDLEGFTEMSHALTPEKVAFVLNAYLDTLSDVVLDHGGTIDKFVGDAVVAFWGAPIARDDDAQKATDALNAMALAGRAFSERMRGELDGSLPPIGRTRVGLHHGEAVVGNFGGDGRIQYTALGDSMNTAARLEAANKQMKTRALASAEALAGAAHPDFVAMGRIRLRGRAKPVDVFEPRPDLSGQVRDAIAALVAAHGAGKGDAYAAARDALAAMEIADRASIDFLLKRLEATQPGEAYALS